VTTVPQQRYGIPSGSHSIIRNLVPTDPAARSHVNRYPFDADYLRRLREGDPATVDHFVSYFRQRLAVKWWKGGVQKSTVEDIVQETAKRVIAKLRSGEGIQSPQSFGAFVFGISNNCMREYRRDIARIDQLDDTVLDLVSPELNGEQKLVREEIREAVRRTLKLMKPREAQILVAVIIEERDKDEVCAEYGITRANLRLILHRAIVRFKFLYNSEKGKLPPGCGM